MSLSGLDSLILEGFGSIFRLDLLATGIQGFQVLGLLTAASGVVCGLRVQGFG